MSATTVPSHIHNVVRFAAGHAPLLPVSREPHIDQMVFIGAGEVVRKRYWPALKDRPYLSRAVAVCGLDSLSPLNSIPHQYFEVLEGNQLPLDRLADTGFSGPNCLYLVTTPSQFHAAYALQAATTGARVAVEKPLAHSSQSARQLAHLAGGDMVYAIDHFLHKDDPMVYLDEYRKDPSLMEPVRRIEARFHEPDTFAPGRTQEHTLFDVGYHLISLAVALAKTRQVGFAIQPLQVSIAAHQPDLTWRQPQAKVPTASRLLAKAIFEDGTVIDLELEQVKAAPAPVKYLTIQDDQGGVLGEMDLSGSREAHARVLTQLERPVPDLPQSLADAIAVVELAELSAKMAKDCGTYPFGSLPAFAQNRAAIPMDAWARPVDSAPLAA